MAGFRAVDDDRREFVHLLLPCHRELSAKVTSDMEIDGRAVPHRNSDMGL